VRGYRDKRATEAYAAELQRAVDRERGGIFTADELDLSESLRLPIDVHKTAYQTHLEAKGASECHRAETLRRLGRVLDECRFGRLADITREAAERWKVQREREGMGPRTLNTYLGSLIAFVNWARVCQPPRMARNPLDGLTKADEACDIRRERRALTTDELVRLLDAAERRPMLDAATIRRGKRKGEAVAILTPDTKARLERLGRERRLIYQTLVLTGLRRGELAGLTWGDLDLNGSSAWLTVRAGMSKNGKTETLPVRADLADGLRAWRADCGNDADTARVFKVPKQLVRILHRDLMLAGIDETGIDVHSLRHTTATHLAKASVAPRTAQRILRHSDIKLTFGTYTDARLLDTAGAVESLPTFKGKPDTDRLRATGTMDHSADVGGLALGAQLGGSHDKTVQSDAFRCAKGASIGGGSVKAQDVRPARVSGSMRGGAAKRATRLERATFSLEG